MRASTEQQRRYLAADYARAKAGQKTRTGMSTAQLRGFARKPTKAKKGR